MYNHAFRGCNAQERTVNLIAINLLNQFSVSMSEIRSTNSIVGWYMHWICAYVTRQRSPHM